MMRCDVMREVQWPSGDSSGVGAFSVDPIV